MAVFFRIFYKEALLGFQAVKLVGFIRGNTAVGGYIHVL